MAMTDDYRPSVAMDVSGGLWLGGRQWRVEGEGLVDKFWVRYKNSLQKMKE